MSFRRFVLIVSIGMAWLALMPQAALAHPLGNFTINQLIQVRVSDGEVDMSSVVDQAEIPTFQLIERFDEDSDGQITGAE